MNANWKSPIAWAGLALTLTIYATAFGWMGVAYYAAIIGACAYAQRNEMLVTNGLIVLLNEITTFVAAIYAFGWYAAPLYIAMTIAMAYHYHLMNRRAYV